MEKEEEDFEKYLGTFATDIWTLLTLVSLEQRQVCTQVESGFTTPSCCVMCATPSLCQQLSRSMPHYLPHLLTA